MFVGLFVPARCADDSLEYFERAPCLQDRRSTWPYPFQGRSLGR
jgi:hypothetical protein